MQVPGHLPARHLVQHARHDAVRAQRLSGEGRSSSSRGGEGCAGGGGGTRRRRRSRTSGCVRGPVPSRGPVARCQDGWPWAAALSGSMIARASDHRNASTKPDPPFPPRPLLLGCCGWCCCAPAVLAPPAPLPLRRATGGRAPAQLLPPCNGTAARPLAAVVGGWWVGGCVRAGAATPLRRCCGQRPPPPQLLCTLTCAWRALHGLRRPGPCRCTSSARAGADGQSACMLVAATLALA